MPSRAATTGFPPRGPRPAVGTSAGGGPRGWLVAVLVGLFLFGPASGCSSKPARKKGKSKAAASRQREEKALVDTVPDRGAATDPPPPSPESAPAPAEAKPESDIPGSEAAGASPLEGAAIAVADEAEARPEGEASAENAPATPAPPDEATMPAARNEKRPVSPLVDPDTTITLDGGRVEVSSPKGWTRTPRSQTCLVRYQPAPRTSIPSIVVTAEPAPVGLETVTRKNQAELVTAITAKLAVDFPAGGAVKVIKKPAPTALGPHAGVAWAVPGSAKIDGLTETIDRFAWGIVLGGRLYVVEVRGPRGKLDDGAKDRAKAVASTLFRPADAPTGNPEAAPPATEPAAGE